MKDESSIELYEHGAARELKLNDKEISSFEKFLDTVWKNRNTENWRGVSEKKTDQKFIEVTRGVSQKEKLFAKSNNYVGVVNWKKKRIHLLPKIFDQEQEYQELSEASINSIHTHILWWLSYSNKFKFPNLRNDIHQRNNDFLEALIYLFAKHALEVLSVSTYHSFEDQESELNYMRGSLDFKKYLMGNFSKGRHHKLDCRFNSLEVDNQFNRIIKYVCRLLLLLTKVKETKKYLTAIILILDDVEDKYYEARDCESIRFNSFFGHMQTILDYCKLFLAGSIINRNKETLQVFAFLLKTDDLYQDFVYGFIKKHIERLTKINPSATKYIGEDTFKSNFLFTDVDGKENYSASLLPDGIIRFNHEEFITDTKYKNLTKDGIKEGDLYQMLAYATRFKIDKIILFYPLYLKYKKEKSEKYIMKDKLADGKEILLRAEQINIILKDWQNLSSEQYRNFSLTRCFEKLTEELKSKIISIFENHGS
ncbi:McrC family protein [Lutimonas vermicola]|uniref:5-methylcytosine-specific restriction enzyme subunit McrC n=1 Tax=Lutimonas vermicola TaxID=414288 RepID=A0ABU9KZU2_9FLAO